MAKTKVLIVGGGFGGVKVALELSSNKNFDVTLVSDNPNFEYHPALYRTATGGRKIISSIPLSDIFQDKSATIIKAKAKTIKTTDKTLTTEDNQKIKYDKIILALGSKTNYFGIVGLQEFSFGMKSLAEAEELKRHLHQYLIEEEKPDSSYIIVGGGPTGVELAGALPDYIKKLLKNHKIKSKNYRISVIEAAPRLVASMPKSISKATAKYLRKQSVKLHFNKAVQGETINELIVDGKPIKSKTVIWTAGTANNSFFKENNFILSKNGKVQIDEYLQAVPDVYVIGDSADTKYSGMAQTALNDAVFLAKNLKNELRGNTKERYKPKRPVYVTPVGENWATVVWGPLRVYGRLGALLRRFADYIGYKDIEPWWKAIDLVLAEDDTEESCAFCAVR